MGAGGEEGARYSVLVTTPRVVKNEKVRLIKAFLVPILNILKSMYLGV